MVSSGPVIRFIFFTGRLWGGSEMGARLGRPEQMNLTPTTNSKKMTNFLIY